LNKVRFLFFLAATSLFGAEVKTPPSFPSLLSVGGGVYNVLRESNKEGMLQLQYMGQPFWGKELFLIRPLISAFGTFKGGLYLCGGFAFDIQAGPYLAITPSFASGFYRRGGSKNLGYPVENRSSLEVSGKFSSGARLGVQFYHLSNGSLSKHNPGVEALLLCYSFPINVL